MNLDADMLQKLPFALRVEIEENAQRKPLTQSELAFEQRRILTALRKHKTPGKRTDLKAGTSGKTFPEVRATDVVGKLFNESRKQVEKRIAVVEAAEAEPDNVEYRRLVETMDKTGRVNAPYRRLTNMRQVEAIRAEPPPLPGNGPYHTGMIDIPWAYEPDDNSAVRGVLPYPTLSIAQACALDIGSIMHADAVLFMWVTNFILARGLHLELLTAWGGFEPKTLVTWPKDRHTFKAHWLRGQTEHMVMAVRGKPVIDLTDQTTLLRGPFHLVRKNKHSAKPREAYEFVERLCPAPRYADLFSRYCHSKKWDCHGDEVGKLSTLADEAQP